MADEEDPHHVTVNALITVFVKLERKPLFIAQTSDEPAYFDDDSSTYEKVSYSAPVEDDEVWPFVVVATPIDLM